MKLTPVSKVEAKVIHSLWRQAERYDYASRQDKSLLVAARHNGYAVALIDALRDNFTEAEVKEVTGNSLREKRSEILEQQDKLDYLFIRMEEQFKEMGMALPQNPETIYHDHEG